MIVCNTSEELFREIRNRYDASLKKVFPVLIGGCSRVGKSTLSQKILTNCTEEGIEASIVALDSWLISVDKRKPVSTVLERYEMDACNKAIEKLLEGETIVPPFYDPVSRKRIAEMSGSPVKISSGILIIEGVIALSDPGLQSKKGVSVFASVPDLTRLKRLLDFYGRIKNIPRSAYRQIIMDREKEEVPFITKSAQFADILYKG